MAHQSDNKTCQTLLKEYRSKPSTVSYKEKIVFFQGMGEKDVYNITAPFEDQGELVIAGRVESRDSEHSQIMFFFVQRGGQWAVREDAPVLQLQDRSLRGFKAN